MKLGDAGVFKRLTVRLWLAFFFSILPIIGAASPLVDGTLNQDPEKILLGIVGVLGGIVTLLAAVVALMKASVPRHAQRPQGNGASSDAGVLIARNAVDIAGLTRDLRSLSDTVRLQGQQIDQARKTAEGNLGTILNRMEDYQHDVIAAIQAVKVDQEVLAARIKALEA